MQAYTTAKQQEKEFQFTLSKFSHEIRNPLALINSELQLMVSSHPEIAAYEGWDDIMDNLEYVKELLNELSDYNNAGKLSLRPTELSPFLHTVLTSFKPTLDYLGIALETDIPSHLPAFPLDQIKMRQALLNLLRNAQESISHSRGKIRVQAKILSDGISVSICDNGCGITPDKQQDIFTPFVTFKSGGTGLGLPITQQIVEAHGGHLEITSTPGQGTEVRIFLG
ncbi:MAG: ATP-binding protein [Eubacteriales bacterium]|nr:ATP-binding protein [Eubacteriales bacterium]